MSSTDRIERQIRLDAPVSRVWQAISDSREFGEWFQCRFKAAFEPGRRVPAELTIPEHEGVTFEILIEAMEHEKRLAYRWHPYAVDTDKDYSNEPTTLVEIMLEPAGDGTHLTVVESGFDALPDERRAECIERNSAGWTAQMDNVKAYVDAR